MPPVWQFKPARRRPGSRLTAFQSWLVAPGARHKVGVAARRSGKTVGVRALGILSCLDDRPGDVGYMAPTLGQAKRLLWRPLMEDLRDPAAAHFLARRPNHSDLYVEFKTGTRLYLYSADAAERVRGDGFKLFITDESDDPRFTPETFDDIIWPALADNGGRLVQIGTPRGRGRLYREFRKGQTASPVDVRDPEYDSIQVTATQAGIITRDEIERARRTRSLRSFRQEYEATFLAPEGMVYDEWSDERHIVTAASVPHTFDEVIVGVDWGIAKRGVFLVMGIDRVWVEGTEDYEGCELARVWVVEEHCHGGLAYAERSGDRPGWWALARQVQRQWAPTRWYCDPAGGDAEENEAEAAGYLRQLQRVLDEEGRGGRVIGADNRVSMGISAVQTFLHHDDVLGEAPRFFVLDRCVNTIRGFQGYRWAPERTEGEYREKPMKVDDHEMDAARYGVFTHFFSTRRSRGRNDAHHESRT